MPKTKKLKIVPHEILPKEIFVKILKKLSYNSIIDARSTCHDNRVVILAPKVLFVSRGRESFSTLKTFMQTFIMLYYSQINVKTGISIAKEFNYKLNSF